jgi:hypothetical protein
MMDAVDVADTWHGDLLPCGASPTSSIARSATGLAYVLALSDFRTLRAARACVGVTEA